MEGTSARATIPYQFEPGERVLWSGRPRQGLVLRLADWGLFPFSLLWGTGMGVVGVLALINHRRVAGVLAGLALLLVGLYAVFGRFATDAYRRSTTRYAITNLRLLIVRTGRFGVTDELGLAELDPIEFKQHRNGYASLIFGVPPGFPMMEPPVNWPSPILRRRPRLDQIQDVDAATEALAGLGHPVSRSPAAIY
ncbi:hypothetical protein BH10ACT3_BH10ACT3_24250 [soil metagenome]